MLDTSNLLRGGSFDLSNRWLFYGIVVLVVSIITVQLWYLVFANSTTMGAYGNFGDEAVMTQAAVRILQGQVPHRDFYSYAPGTAYVPLAVWMYIFGQEYSVVRWFNFLTTLALAAAIMWLASTFSRWLALLTGLIFAFIIFPIWPMVSYHWQFLLLAVLATRLLIDEISNNRLILAGTLLALAGFLLPNKAIFLALALIAVIIIFTAQDKILISVIRLMAIPLIMGILFIYILMIFDLLKPIWNQLIYNNITFYPSLLTGSLIAFKKDFVFYIIISLSLFIPLLYSSWRWPEWRKKYTIVAIVNSSLVLSLFYYSEIFHLTQTSAFLLILIFVAPIVTLESAVRCLLEVRPIRLISMLVVGVFLISISSWWLNNLIVIQTVLAINASPKYQSSLMTPQGVVYINSHWRSGLVGKPAPIVNQLPEMDRLLRTTLANHRVFFYPFAPGYYYFYKKSNPTSYDLLPSANLPQPDEEKLKRELIQNTDTLVYIRNDWHNFDTSSELFKWMRDNFPYQMTILNGDILIFSKKNLTEI